MYVIVSSFSEHNNRGGHALIRNRSFRLAVVLAFSILIETAPAKTPHLRPQKALVRFLAASTCIRVSLGRSQDLYLVEIALHTGSEPVLARLMDEPLPYQPPLSRDILTSTTGTILRVKRDEQCDLPYGKMLLRTAPGDLMAIIPVKLHYQPQLSKTPAPDEVLPCYRTMRP
jgi:hypothetical protein